MPADPFAELFDNEEDPFSALMQTGGDPFQDLLDSPYSRITTRNRKGQRIVDPEYTLSQLEDLAVRTNNDSGFIKTTLSNIGPNIKDLVSGLSKLTALGVRGVGNVARLPHNFVMGDDEDVNEIFSEFTSAFKAVPEIVMSEVDRVREIYGPIVTNLDFNPLKQFIQERPVDFALDLAMGADLAALPVKGAAIRATRGAGQALKREGPRQLGSAEFSKRLFDAEIDPDAIARAAISSNDEVAAGMRQMVFDLAGPESLELFDKATLLNKTVDKIRLGNPFRAAFATIGAFPPARRMIDQFKNAAIAKAETSRIARQAESLRHEYDEFADVALDGFRQLDDADKNRALHYGQSLTPEPLTGPLAMAQAGLQAIGEKFEQFVVQRYMIGGMEEKAARLAVDQRKMANAITGEARFRTTGHLADEISDVEKTVLNHYRHLPNTDDLVKNPQRVTNSIKTLKGQRDELVEKLRKTQAGTDEWNDLVNQLGDNFATREVEQIRLGLIEQAEARLAAGELHFVPGQRTAVDVELLGIKNADDFLAELADDGVTKMNRASSEHLSKKTDIVTNPMEVEANLFRYVTSMTKMLGDLEVLDQVRAVGTIVAKEGMDDLLRDVAIAKETGKNLGWDTIKIPATGETYTLPRGMGAIYLDAVKRSERGGAALKAIDFTKNEFTKVVLAMSPQWVMYNIFGGSALYALAGGSPVQLAKAIGMRTATALEPLMKKSPQLDMLVGNMIRKGAAEWRELVPQAMVKGFASRSLADFRIAENMTPAQIKWGEMATQRVDLQAMMRGEQSMSVLLDKYSQATTALTEAPSRLSRKLRGKDVRPAGFNFTLGDLNEVVEEIYRAATWLSIGRRQIHKSMFLEGGTTLIGMNSKEMRARFAQMASELDPKNITIRGSMKMSPETKTTMDLTNRFMNDYYALGPIERGVFRRIFPFYSWIKFTNRLAAELPYAHPIRMSIAAHTSNAINDAKAIEGPMPEWMQDFVHIRDNPDGTQTFQSGRGSNVFIGVVFGGEGAFPIDPKEALAGLNPFLLVPIQWGFGFDAFRGQKFRVAPERAGRQGLVQPFGGNKAFKLGPEGLRETDAKPSPALALARGGILPIPFFRQAERAIRGGPHDDVGSISELGVELSNMLLGHPRMYPGAWLDEASGKPFEAGDTGTQLLGSLGIRAIDFDTERLKQRETEDRLSAIKRILKETEGR